MTEPTTLGTSQDLLRWCQTIYRVNTKSSVMSSTQVAQKKETFGKIRVTFELGLDLLQSGCNRVGEIIQNKT